MTHPSQGKTGTAPSAITTILACCWGFTSAYVLIRSLLEEKDLRTGFAAIVPLILVWATLERKRWGRLALFGLSAMALGMFIAALAVMAASAPHLSDLASLQKPLLNTLALLDRHNPMNALIFLGLAALTLFWLRRPNVVSEFERGKNAKFSVGQRVIAASLVGCWCVAMAMTPITRPLTRATNDKDSTSKSVARGKSVGTQTQQKTKLPR